MRQDDDSTSPISTFLSCFDYISITQKRQSTTLGQITLFFHDSQLTNELKNIANQLIGKLEEKKKTLSDPNNWHPWLEEISVTLDAVFNARLTAFCRKHDRSPRTPDEYILPGEFENSVLKGLRALRITYSDNQSVTQALDYINLLISKATTPGYRFSSAQVEQVQHHCC